MIRQILIGSALFIGHLFNLPAQPVITLQPQSQTNGFGATVAFHVEATGTPPLHYQWRDYSNFILFTEIPSATNATLVLTNVMPTNHRLAVQVSNPEGSALSDRVQLIVILPPTIISSPTSQVVREGQRVVLTVEPESSSEPPDYQWFFNGFMISGAREPSLLFPRVQVSDAGAYSVILSNRGGLVESSIAVLTVLPRIEPGFDRNIPVEIAREPTDESSAIILTWPSTPGRTYDLLHADQIEKPQVPVFQDPIVASSSSITIVEEIDQPAEFYKAYEQQALAANVQPITATSLEEWEKVSGLAFTAAERTQMLVPLTNPAQDINRVSYEAIRQVKLYNGDPLSLAFDPLPVGFDFQQSQDPLLWSSPLFLSRPNDLNELAFYSVRDLGELIRQKRVTSSELTELCLARFKRYDSDLRCVVTLTEELARQQAARADQEIQAGIYRGPLHGIPYGIKDLFAVKDYPTTWGAPPFRDQVFDEDASVVRKLEEAGAVLVAKLSTGELAGGDIWFGGQTRNPWNVLEGSGGSSAGPAAAVAAGLVPFAIGTETLGSIVSPCTRCRVTGLRSTYGRVSRTGAMTLSWSMDKVGPISRNVEDCAIVFESIRGADGRDRSVIDPPFNYDPNLDLSTLRIGYRSGLGSGVRDRLALLTGGSPPIELALPSYPYLAMRILIRAESAAVFDELTRFGGDDLLTLQGASNRPNLFRASRTIPAVEYLLADRLRFKLIQEMHLLMSDIDLFVADGFDSEVSHLSNYTGQPCVAIPNGGGSSLCFIGKLYDEATILAFAKAYQDATQIHTNVPPMFAP